jgi:hypothetical protein
MNNQASQNILEAALRCRLAAAEPELRAMAMADAVDWMAPRFVTTDAQQTAINCMLLACHQARAAMLGASPLGDAGDDEPCAANECPQHIEPLGRLSALSRAIGDGARAVDLLRKAGLRAVVLTRLRDAEPSASASPLYADLRFRPYVTKRVCAATRLLPRPAMRGEETLVPPARVIKIGKTLRILPPRGSHAVNQNQEFEADRRWLNSMSIDKAR